MTKKEERGYTVEIEIVIGSDEDEDLLAFQMLK